MFGGAAFATSTLSGVMPSASVVDADAVWASDPFTVELDGVAIRLAANTLTGESRAGEQSTASFTLINPSPVPVVGQPVRVLWFAEVIFAGTIDRITVTANKPGSAIAYACECVDWSQILFRRKLHRNWNDLPLVGLADSVLDNELAGEGLTIGTSDVAASIPLVSADRASAYDVFKNAAASVGATFYVDREKRLFFVSISAPSIPITLDQSVFESASLTQTREDYRNRQTVIAKGTVPDGASGDAVTSSRTLTNSEQVTARASLEGGTGLYEEFEEVTHPTSNDPVTVTVLALAVGRLRLAVSGALRSTFSGRVRSYGFLAGMTGTLAFPLLGISSGQWVIQRVTFTEQDGRVLLYDLELTQTSLERRAYESWLKMASGGQVVILPPGALTNNLTTYNTPGTYTFTVPGGITTIEITCYGASGGGGGGAYFNHTGFLILRSYGGSGGPSGRAVTTISVVPGQEIAVDVGAAGLGGVGEFRADSDGPPYSATGHAGTAGEHSVVSAGGIIVCQGDGSAGGAGGYAPWGGSGIGDYLLSPGADGSTGSGIGDAVSVGGGVLGGAGGPSLNPGGQQDGSDGQDGRVEIRY